MSSLCKFVLYATLLAHAQIQYCVLPKCYIPFFKPLFFQQGENGSVNARVSWLQAGRPTVYCT